MQPPRLPSRNRKREQRVENAGQGRHPHRYEAFALIALWAILAACGRPTWAGGIHATLAWSPRGVRVIEVPEQGAAARAGLQPEDRLVSVDGQPVAGLDQKQVHALLTGEVGTHVELVILRDDEPVQLRIERIPYGAIRNE